MGNRNIRERAGQLKYYRTWRDFDLFIWQLPLLAFVCYFAFVYLRNGLYIFIFSHFVFFMVLGMWNPVREMLYYKAATQSNTRWQKMADWIYRTLYWGIPALFLFIFWMKWEK
jgi:hypothetical protein